MEEEAESMEGVEYPLQLAGLSEDVIIEILTRLPVKSLLKFKCVSKAWYSLISTKYFIEAHLKNSTNNKSFSRHKIIANVRHQRWRVEQYCFRSLQSERRTYSSRFHRMLDNPKALHLIGSCNGLICILIDREYLFLWNPATRVSKKLPPISHVGQIEVIQCGFGFDENSDDYKVFVILSVNNFDKFGQVYSFKADAWKRVEIVDGDIFSSRTVEGKLANGKLHWMLLGASNSNIAAFDLKRETYGMLELPIYIGAGFVPTLGVLNGCLCLLCDSYVTHRLDVWIWDQYGKQDSWRRLLTICDSQENKPIPHPLCVLPNKDVLFIYGSSLISYNSTNKLGWHHRDSHGVVGADFFIESLVSLPSDDVNTRGNPRKRGRASYSKLLSL